MAVKRHGKHLVSLKFPQSTNKDLLSHWKRTPTTSHWRCKATKPSCHRASITSPTGNIGPWDPYCVTTWSNAQTVGVGIALSVSPMAHAVLDGDQGQESPPPPPQTRPSKTTETKGPRRVDLEGPTDRQKHHSNRDGELTGLSQEMKRFKTESSTASMCSTWSSTEGGCGFLYGLTPLHPKTARAQVSDVVVVVVVQQPTEIDWR